MKIFKKMTALAVAAVLSTSAYAGMGNGETPETALATEQEMKDAVHHNIGQLNLKDFNITDCSVHVIFTVNADGKVSVKDVYGNSTVAISYVRARLENKKMFVAPELQNTKHRTTIRFVLI